MISADNTPDYDNIINVAIGSNVSSIDTFAGADPFAKSWDDLRTYSGLDDANAKRRMTRKANTIFGMPPTPKYEDDSKMQPSGIKEVGSKQINPGKEYANGYSTFDVITPPYNLYQLASYYDKNFANHAAIAAKVMNAVGNGYSFDMTSKAKQKKADSKNKKDLAFIDKKVNRLKSELTDLIESLNDVDSFTTTMRKVVTDLESTGNGYIEIGRTVRGNIGYLGHIPAITMRVRRLHDGYVQIINNRIVYFRNFGAVNSDPIGGDPSPNEIIHLKKYSPLNTYYGVPDITSAMPSMIGDELAEQYNVDYFDNKAVPRYVIVTKGAKMSSESEDRMFKFLQTNLKGQSHRTLYVPLPADTPDNKVSFEMMPVENKVQEASFKEYRKANRDNILVAHQVPLSKLGSTDSSAVASAISQDRTFRDQVCRPLQQYVERSVAQIVSEQTDMIEIKFNEMNIVDEVQQSTIHKTYFDIGAMLPNEIRDDIGRPAIEGLDEKADKEKEAQDARDNARVQQQSDGPSAMTGRNPKGSGSKQDGNNV